MLTMQRKGKRHEGVFDLEISRLLESQPDVNPRHCLHNKFESAGPFNYQRCAADWWNTCSSSREYLGKDGVYVVHFSLEGVQ